MITFTPPGVGVKSGSGSFREVDQYSSVGRRTGDCGRSRSDGAVAVARPWGATHGLPVSPDGRLAAGWTGVGNDRSATRLGRRGRVRLIVSVLVRAVTTRPSPDAAIRCGVRVVGFRRPRDRWCGVCRTGRSARCAAEVPPPGRTGVWAVVRVQPTDRHLVPATFPRIVGTAREPFLALISRAPEESLPVCCGWPGRRFPERLPLVRARHLRRSRDTAGTRNDDAVTCEDDVWPGSPMRPPSPVWISSRWTVRRTASRCTGHSPRPSDVPTADETCVSRADGSLSNPLVRGVRRRSARRRRGAGRATIGR